METDLLQPIAGRTDSGKQLRTFTVLYELAIAMTADHGLDENLQLVVDRSRELLETDTSYIALRDETGGQVFMHTVSGVRTESFKKVRLPLGQGLGGLVAQTKRGYIIEDYFTDKNIMRVVDDVVRKEGIISGMAAPIQIGQENLGVLYVFDRAKREFSQSDLDTLFLIANLAAGEIARKRAEETLRESREQYRSVMEANGDPIIVYDDKGRVVYCNPAFSRVFGWSLKELIGKRAYYVPDENWSETYDAMAELYNDETGYLSFESQRKTKKGEILDVIISASVYRGSDGAPLGMIANLRDITERKRAEEALRDSKEKYRSVMEASGEPIVVYDVEGRVLYFNPAFTRVFGWTLEELRGKRIPYVPDDLVSETRARINEVLTSPEGYSSYESRRYTKSGETLDTIVSASAFRDRHGKNLGMIANLRDITARKRAEEALAKSEEQLRQLSAQLLTAQETERKRIAHELHDGIGQTLTAVKFGLESVAQQAGIRCKGQMETLKALVPLVQAAIDDVARMSIDLRPSTLDDLGILTTIKWFCREFQRIYSGIRIEKEISLEEEEVPEDLKIVVFRVLQEAFNNIAKHSGSNCVCVSLQGRAGSIELAIRDNGVGFDQDAVFSAKRYRKGFGLASMRERVHLSGGSFSIHTGPDSGTTIRAAWPLR